MPNRMKYTEDMFLNKKFERLYITGPVEYVDNGKGGMSKRIVYADCDCGRKHVPVDVLALMRGEKKSCGCLGKENLKKLGEGRHNGTIKSSGNTRHGDSKGGEYKQLYSSWSNMRNRCKYESCANYQWYGGRGITVCKEWDTSYENFKEWALANGWAPGLEIDRIDNDKNYEPSNCRWATRKEQTNNARSNVKANVYGMEMNISQWGEYLNVDPGTIRQRIYRGATPEDAVNRSINENTGVVKPFIYVNKNI